MPPAVHTHTHTNTRTHVHTRAHTDTSHVTTPLPPSLFLSLARSLALSLSLSLPPSRPPSLSLPPFLLSFFLSFSLSLSLSLSLSFPRTRVRRMKPVMALAFSVGPSEGKGRSGAGKRACGTAPRQEQQCQLLAGDDDGIMWAWPVPPTPRSCFGLATAEQPLHQRLRSTTPPHRCRHASLARTVRADVCSLLAGEGEEEEEEGGERGAISAMAVIDLLHVVVTGCVPAPAPENWPDSASPFAAWATACRCLWFTAATAASAPAIVAGSLRLERGCARKCARKG